MVDTSSRVTGVAHLKLSPTNAIKIHTLHNICLIIYSPRWKIEDNSSFICLHCHLVFWLKIIWKVFISHVKQLHLFLVCMLDPVQTTVPEIFQVNSY